MKRKSHTETKKASRGRVHRLVRLIRGHAKDCYAVTEVQRGNWKSPWTGLVEEVRWLSEAGDKRGHWRPWLVVRCNCTHCPALKMVSSDVLAEIEPNVLINDDCPPKDVA